MSYHDIQNIRYSEDQENKIAFDYKGHLILINDSKEVILVGFGESEGPKRWIWKHYGFILDCLEERDDVYSSD